MRDLFDLYQQSEAAVELAEIHDLVQPTLDELARELGYERAFLALVDLEHRTLMGAAGVNVPDGLIEVLQAHPDEQSGVLFQSVRLGQPLRVDDVLRDTRIPLSTREQYLAFGLLAFAVIPLAPAAGALIVSKDRPLDEAEIGELLPYAGRITAAIVDRLESRRLREAEDRRAVEREWLWWMVNAVQDPILVSDEQDNVLLHNVPAERLLVAHPGDGPGKRRAIELNNVLLSAALSRFRLDQGDALGRELTLVDPIEGNELLFEMICQPAANLRTGERGLVSVLKDVTDLRRASEEARHSFERLQAAGADARRERDRLNLILENVADPIVVGDPGGEIILMNHQAERLLQPAPDETVQGRASPYVTNLAKLNFFVSQLGLDRVSTRRGDVSLVDPSTGEPLTMSVTATEIRNELDQVTAIVSVLHDLSQIRELERRRVEQQLFESQKLAAVGRLAAAMAHEINNPLEAIKNALYLSVSHLPDDDPNRRFLEIASKETIRVSNTIRQMLGFYRPKAEKLSCNVNDVAEDTLGLLQRHLNQHRVAVQRQLQRDLPTVLASPDQLKQVFLNLILNAQESMPNGGTLGIVTRLSRETDTELLAGRYVLIQIRDTGQGIDEEHLPHIFEPFFSTKTHSRGTGLGLWVSLEIVQEHGGQIRVRSRPGHGTTFTISLPPEDN